MPKPNFAKAIGIAGLTSSVMDISAALIVYGAMGAKPLRLLQGIAGGVLGPRAYGIAVYFFMNRVVVPLSAATKYPFSVKSMLIGVVIHIFCVGIPICLNIGKYAR